MRDLATYLEAARHNLNAPIEALPKGVTLADSIYEFTLDCLHEPKWVGTAKMFLFAHSGWRQAVLVTMIGGSGHAAAILRQSLEASIYGYLFCRDTNYLDLWQRGEVDRKALTKFRNGAQKRAMKFLEEEDELLASRIRECLNDLISFGAHANFLSVELGIDILHFDDEDAGQMNYSYLGDGESRMLPFVLACKVAELSLLLFAVIYPDRARYMGYGERIQDLRLEVLRLIREWEQEEA